jgi:hypothetical protein
MNEFITFKKIPRLNREVILTEKIDGTNAQILISPTNNPDPQALCAMPMDVNINPGQPPTKIFYNVYAGSRSRWLNLINDNHGFAKWVMENVYTLVSTLGVGRFYGEWWGKGIQRGYGLEEKRFSLFNPDFEFRCDPEYLVRTVPILYRGNFDSLWVSKALELLKQDGSHAAPGYMNPEGVVIYHTASGHLFKRTFENDEGGKNE